MKTLLTAALLALSLNADMCDIYLKQTYKNLKLSDKAHDFGFKTEQKTYASLAELNAKQVMLHCSDSVDQKYASDVIEVTSLILEK